MDINIKRIKRLIVRHTTFNTRWTLHCLLKKHGFSLSAVLALFAGPLILFLNKLT